MSVTTNNSDESGKSGPISFDTAIELALKIPKVRIDREKFLLDQAGNAIKNDADRERVLAEGLRAVMSDREVEKKGKKRVNRTAIWSTGVSVMAALPGGPWGTIVGSSTDIVQSLVYSLRLSQELAYIYGYPFFDGDENGKLSDHDTDIFVLFLGTMYDVAGSAEGIRTTAFDARTAVARGEETAAQVALGNAIYFPIIKAVAKRFGTRLTKGSFRRSAARFIPIAGALSIGGINFTAMRNGGHRLNDELALGLNYSGEDYHEDRETLKNI